MPGRSRTALATLAPDDGTQRASDDAKVEPQALVAQVIELVLQLLEGVQLRRPVVILDLRPPSDTRSHEVAGVVEGDYFAQLRDVSRLLRAGPDDGEIATQHVPDLRELVDVESPQHPPDGAEPVVIGFGPARRCLARAHRAELVNHENGTVF